ncbi:Hypothetical predicted protein, partial [Marmota monax]
MASALGSGCLTHFWRYWTILWSRLASSANVSEFSEDKQRNRILPWLKLKDPPIPCPRKTHEALAAKARGDLLIHRRLRVLSETSAGASVNWHTGLW